LLGAGEIKAAISVFKKNVERHPGSANVYDSFGDAYDAANELQLALESYQKATEIARKNSNRNLKVYEENYQRLQIKFSKK